MMQYQLSTTPVFLYHQRQYVVLMDTTTNYFSRRFTNVYSKNLIAHKGTDNQILIEFLNQDQKNVDVTGMTFTCRLISQDGSTLLLEKPLDTVNTLRGQMKLVLTEQELDPLQSGLAGYSIEQTADLITYEPVFVNDHAGGRGVINIVDSILPEFNSSTNLTIPSHVGSPYTTSTINTDDVDLYTFQVIMNAMIGTIEVQGAADNDGYWYTIQTETISTASNLYTFNVNGYHPYLRLNITETSGSVTSITYR